MKKTAIQILIVCNVLFGTARNARTIVPRPGVEGEEGYNPTLKIPVDKEK